MNAVPAEERTLRAKYLDWCSARVAERFLELSPDQIYELAHSPAPSVPVDGAGAASGDAVAAEAERASAASSRPAPATGRVPPAGAEEGPGFRTLVERVMEALAIRLELPSFEAWAEAYRRAPERYERELLGLWRSRRSREDAPGVKGAGGA